MERLITLMTDFGLEDEYVGVMKGVLLARAPAVRLLDLTHNLPPQDLRRAAYLIEASYRYFPAGTLHVIVVDPGVGTGRRIIVVQSAGQLFLAPDNGVLSLIIKNDLTAAHEVRCRELFLEPVSRTFHGRDIFAPVAAALALGRRPETMGPLLRREELEILPLPEPVLDSAQGILRGEVIDIDRFGNLTTNINEEQFSQLAQPFPGASPAIAIGGRVIAGLSPAYGRQNAGSLLALFGSRGYLEIAVNQGDAARELAMGIGKEVVVSMKMGIDQ